MMPRLPYIIPPAPQPRWANAGKTMIDLKVIFPHLGPNAAVYTAAQSDPGWEHSEELFARAAGGEFGPVAPYVAPPAPVPASITRRQCAREMFERNLASGPEMVAMARNGTPPSIVVDLLSGIEPEADRFRAEADFAADLYERSNPLLIALMTATGATSAQIDDFFRAAATR